MKTEIPVMKTLNYQIIFAGGKTKQIHLKVFNLLVFDEIMLNKEKIKIYTIGVF